MATLSDSHGHSVTLGAKIGEGGEGAVYAVDGADVVAKLYLKSMAEWQARKIDAMASNTDPNLHGVAAWPLGLLFDKTKPVGFTMPRLSNSLHPLHDLTGPKTRKRLYPNANWKFLVHTGVNISHAFEVLHGHQVVVGDVNSTNIVVKTDSTSRLIDCDSFQVRAGNTLYPCQVGVPEYQPPELHGVDLSKVERLPQHDLFGLAIIIFELLFVGRHPFAGTIRAANRTDNSIEANIQARRFFYATDARARGLDQPPGVPTLAAITPQLAQLFLAAFTGPPAQRPSAANWRTALMDLETKTVPCPANVAHRMLKDAPCPWCALERSGTTPYFLLATPTTASGDVDTSVWTTFSNAEVERIWAQISAVQAPPTVDPSIKPELPYHAAPLDMWTRKRMWLAAACAFIVIAAGSTCIALNIGAGVFWDIVAAFTGWFFIRPDVRELIKKRRALFESLERDFNDAKTRWESLAKNTAFTNEKNRLSMVHADLLGQRQKRDEELRGLERDRERKEREAFLDTFVIADVKIKNIGPKTIQLLRSYGIETAADIVENQLYRVPSIPYTRVNALLMWRRQVESRFRFDSRKSIDKAVLNELEGRYARQRVNWKQQLLGGRQALEQLREQIIRDRAIAQDRVRGVSHLYWQAEADLRVNKVLYRC